MTSPLSWRRWIIPALTDHIQVNKYCYENFDAGYIMAVQAEHVSGA